jgi:hypothetical protein
MILIKFLNILNYPVTGYPKVCVLVLKALTVIKLTI